MQSGQYGSHARRGSVGANRTVYTTDGEGGGVSASPNPSSSCVARLSSISMKNEAFNELPFVLLTSAPSHRRRGTDKCGVLPSLTSGRMRSDQMQEREGSPGSEFV